MGIMLSKDQGRDSELNKRISSDLRQRLQSSERGVTDFGEDHTYVEGTKKTGRFTWVWIILIILAILSLLCIIFI